MSGVVVEARGVGRRLGGRWALRDVNLTVGSGQMVLLHGPNGSGKTTLLRVLSSALSPTVGTVQLFGNVAIEQRSRLGLLSHADGHYDELSGRDNLHLASALGRLKGSVPAVLERVGLHARADDPVRAYSAGMRKRLSFARLLLKDPPLVLLDEPYSALDPEGHNFVDGLLAEFRAEGRTVIVSTHQISRVGRWSTLSIRLEAGRVANGDAPTVDTPATRDSPAHSALPEPTGGNA